jgi:hypothetical protein
MLNARLAEPGAATAVGVKASPKGGVVCDQGVTCSVFAVSIVAGEWSFAAVVGTIEKAAARAPAKFVGVLELLWYVLVRERYDYWWWWCVAEYTLRELGWFRFRCRSIKGVGRKLCDGVRGERDVDDLFKVGKVYR